MTPIKKTTDTAGFALLITIMVLSVVTAVTLAIVELSLKQLALSVDSKDSEIAFHAANAGLECARYMRRTASTTFETGNDVTSYCFGSPVTVTEIALGVPRAPAGTTNGVVYRYEADFQWGSGSSIRCSEVSMVVIAVTATATPAGITIGNGGSPLTDIMPGYPATTKTCEAGGRCTIASVTGYSAACANKSDADTLRREILLEF